MWWWKVRRLAGALFVSSALMNCAADDDDQQETKVDYATCKASCEYANQCDAGDTLDCSDGSDDIRACKGAFESLAVSCLRALKSFYQCMVTANSCDTEGETACGAEVDAVSATCNG